MWQVVVIEWHSKKRYTGEYRTNCSEQRGDPCGLTLVLCYIILLWWLSTQRRHVAYLLILNILCSISSAVCSTIKMMSWPELWGTAGPGSSCGSGRCRSLKDFIVKTALLLIFFYISTYTTTISFFIFTKHRVKIPLLEIKFFLFLFPGNSLIMKPNKEIHVNCHFLSIKLPLR